MVHVGLISLSSRGFNQNITTRVVMHSSSQISATHSA